MNLTAMCVYAHAYVHYQTLHVCASVSNRQKCMQSLSDTYVHGHTHTLKEPAAKYYEMEYSITIKKIFKI